MNNVVQNTSTCLALLMLAPVLAGAADETVPSPDDKSSKVLSVAPLDHIDYPVDRPHWVGDPPNLNDSTHSRVVVAGPSDTPEESAELLKIMQRAEVASYIDWLTGADGRLDFPINDQWIERELITSRYSGQVTQGETTLHEQAVMLEFSPETQARIRAAWANVEVRDRLGALGVMIFGGLMCLILSSTVFGGWSRRVERREAMQSAAA